MKHIIWLILGIAFFFIAWPVAIAVFILYVVWEALLPSLRPLYRKLLGLDD